MGALVLEIHDLDPAALVELRMAPFEWEQGRNIEQGMAALRQILAQLKGEAL